MGIVGIERKLEEKRKETDKNISEVRQRNRLTGSHIQHTALEYQLEIITKAVATIRQWAPWPPFKGPLMLKASRTLFLMLNDLIALITFLAQL